MSRRVTFMTQRRLHNTVDQNSDKAASLTESQSRVILGFEDAPVRDAVIAGGLLLFPNLAGRGNA